MWYPKNLAKWGSKSIKINLNFHIEIYLKFSSILLVGTILTSDFLVGGVRPTSMGLPVAWGRGAVGGSERVPQINVSAFFSMLHNHYYGKSI